MSPHPLHAHLLAMDGSLAYLNRLLELAHEMRYSPTPHARTEAHRCYCQVLANYCHWYPNSPVPHYV